MKELRTPPPQQLIHSFLLSLTLSFHCHALNNNSQVVAKLDDHDDGR